MTDGNDINFSEPEDERARRLRVLIETRARQGDWEWPLYIEEDARKYGIERAELQKLIKAKAKEIETKRREEQAIERKHEQTQREDQRREQDREEREEREARRREEREEREEQRRAKAQRERRLRAFDNIGVLPVEEHEPELRKLAVQLEEDFESLQTEFAEWLALTRERLLHEPWPEPVATRDLLNELTVQLKRYLVLPQPEAATAMVLWVCFSWVHDIATYSPILAITSADADSAKSTASQIIARLTQKPHLLSEPSAASVYHLVDDNECPTLIVDDADRLLPRFPNLAHIVNAAWQRGAKVSRFDSRAKRNIYYDAFYPKLINGIDILLHLRPATRTRCITITLKPKLPTEKVTSFRFADNDEQFVVLQRKLRRWSMDNSDALKQAKPAMPKGYSDKFTNRLEENYTLLFAIADLAGAKWGKRARDAAVKLTPIEPLTDKRRLLADIARLFVEHGIRVRQQTVIVSDRLTALLAADVNSEWADYQGRGPINQFKVAHMLRTFGIRTHQMWLNGKNVNVYRFQDFKDDFKRYLPPGLQPKLPASH
jgi:Protein of unknown function (DUF3631)